MAGTEKQGWSLMMCISLKKKKRLCEKYCISNDYKINKNNS